MKTLVTFAILALTTGAAFAQAHGSGTINAGDKLFMYFEHGTQTTMLNFNSGSNTSGTDGFLWNGYTTFTALHQSSLPSSPSGYDSLGARSGSFIELQLTALSGPAGAKFAFYDNGGTDPLWVYQIGTGFLSGNGKITLTQQSYFEGDPLGGIPSDPFGHIHGRTFGVDASGTFTATWILHDTQNSTTLLLDSDAYATTYTAVPVPEPAALSLLGLAAAWMILRAGLRRRCS
jgi:hypothetical protein